MKDYRLFRAGMRGSVEGDDLVLRLAIEISCGIKTQTTGLAKLSHTAWGKYADEASVLGVVFPDARYGVRRAARRFGFFLTDANNGSLGRGVAARPRQYRPFLRSMSMDRLAAMETFVAVVDSGSFSAAARRLNVGQPAVSKLVAQLEARLGVKLLVRTTHGLTPTEAGLNFYERARRSIEEADEAELAARGASKGLSGRLRVSAAATFARIHVIPHIPEFLAGHPDLAVDLVLDDRNVDLVREGIDVALRMGRLVDSTLTARLIASCGHAVLGTPAYFARAGEPATPADLLGHDVIVYAQRGGGAAWTFRRDGTEVPMTLSGRLRISAAEGVRAAVLAHAGIAIVSEWMFTPEIADGTVSTVLRDWELPQLELWAVFPAGRSATTKARTFISFVEKLMRPPRAVSREG